MSMDKLEQLLLAYFYDVRIDAGVAELVLASDRSEVSEISDFLRGEAELVRRGEARPFQVLKATVLPDVTNVSEAAIFLDNLAERLDRAALLTK